MGTERIYLEFDKTGASPDNLVKDEPHELLGMGQRLIIPDYCSYYSDTLVVRQVATDGTKTQVDKSKYRPVEHLSYISFQTNKPVYAGLLITDPALTGPLELTYQTTGGLDQANVRVLKEQVDAALKASMLDWNTLDHPAELLPTDHIHHVDDLYHAEPLINAVKRIGEVIGLIDVKLERKFLGENTAIGFGAVFDVYDTAWSLRLQAMRLICVDVHNTLIFANKLSTFDANAKQVILDKIRMMKDQIAQYAMNRQGAVYAMVLRDLVRQQFDSNGKILPSPKLVPGLVSWLDVSTATTGPRGFVLKDSLDPTQIWAGSGAVPVTNAALGSKAVRLSDANTLACSGAGIALGPNTTLFVISAKSTDLPSKGVLLKSGLDEVSIDIESGSLLKMVQQTKTTVSAQSQAEDTYPAHIGVFAFGDEAKDSYCESNSIRSTYRGFNNFEVQPTPKRQTFKQIGSAQAEQHIDIAEILVYDRYLSKYEVDAVVEYLSLKYAGLRTNLVANGDFNDGLAEFETDYPLTYQALNPFEIACLSRIDLNMDNTVHYTTGLFEPALTAKVAGDRFLAVHQKYNVWADQKMFWMQRHKLIRGQMYRLDFDLYFTKNQFPYLVLMDGTGRRIGCYPTNKTIGGCERISFGFMAREENCLLKLFSDSRSTVDFAIDHITLVRDFRMPVPFTAVGKTADNVLSAVTLNNTRFIRVRAKSDLNNGGGAAMEVWVDGFIVGAITVNNSVDWADFTFATPLLKTASQVDIKFTNDANSAAGGDRNLNIASITDGVSTVTPNSTNYTVDAGSGGANATKSMVTLWSNGTMHVVWPTVN